MLAIRPVSVAKSPAPAIINMHAMIRPSVVNGYLSPYPTVVIVTNAHQKASPVSLMFAAGESSTLSTATALKTITHNELAATAANDVNFLCPKKKVRRFFIDRNARRTRKMRMIRTTRPTWKMFTGRLETKSIQPHFRKLSFRAGATKPHKEVG